MTPRSTARIRSPELSRCGLLSAAGSALLSGSKHLAECVAQRGVDVRHCCLTAERGQRGDAVPGNAARHDAGVIAEVGVHIERDAVIGDPAAHPDADGGDLVFMPTAIDPDADATLAPLAGD